VSIDALLRRAAHRPARLLLAGGDVTVLQAAVTRLREAGIDGGRVVGGEGLEPERHHRLNSVALLLRSREPDRVHDGIHALDLAGDPVRFACGLLALGDADALVAGPGVSHEALAAAAEWTLGPPLDEATVHTAMWLLCADGSLVAFADAADPDDQPALQQARLARAVAHTHVRVTDAPARVAFLTGPPHHDVTRSAAEAVDRLLAIDPGTEAEADPAARFRRRADVLIFPNGMAGYLAARTVRALGGALLLGPLLLGPPGTVAGVAEDCTMDELVGTAALAILAAGSAAT
jgi:phosphotransacetylase